MRARAIFRQEAKGPERADGNDALVAESVLDPDRIVTVEEHRILRHNDQFFAVGVNVLHPTEAVNLIAVRAP